MRILLLAPLLLAACAQEPREPLDDAQRAMVLQMLMNRQPMQIPQIQYHPMQIQPPQRQWNCTTVPIGGGQTSTTCQ